MRLESLEHFLEAARVESFTVAAKHLYISQQGLSKSIQTLERDLGVDLFIRDGNKVLLTDAGKELISLAEDCLLAARRLNEEMSKARSNTLPAAQKLVLYAMPFVSGLFSFLEGRPDAAPLTNVIVEEMSLYKILAALEEPQPTMLAAIGIPSCDREKHTADPRITFSPLFTSEMALIGAPEQLASRREKITPAEIASLPVAYYSEPVLNRLIARLFKDHPFEHLVMHSSNYTKLQALLEKGEAVSFSDSFSLYLNGYKSNIVQVEIEDTLSFVVGFVFSSVADLDPEYRGYMQHFKDYFSSRFKSYYARYPLQ